jgi:hypothetical protein
MMGMQCPQCVRYRGNLTCDAFPQRIPEEILTGQYDHTRPLQSETKLYEPIPTPRFERKPVKV